MPPIGKTLRLFAYAFLCILSASAIAAPPPKVKLSCKANGQGKYGKVCNSGQQTVLNGMSELSALKAETEKAEISDPGKDSNLHLERAKAMMKSAETLRRGLAARATKQHQALHKAAADSGSVNKELQKQISILLDGAEKHRVLVEKAEAGLQAMKASEWEFQKAKAAYERDGSKAEVYFQYKNYQEKAYAQSRDSARARAELLKQAEPLKAARDEHAAIAKEATALVKEMKAIEEKNTKGAETLANMQKGIRSDLGAVEDSQVKRKPPSDISGTEEKDRFSGKGIRERMAQDGVNMVKDGEYIPASTSTKDKSLTDLTVDEHSALIATGEAERRASLKRLGGEDGLRTKFDAALTDLDAKAEKVRSYDALLDARATEDYDAKLKSAKADVKAYNDAYTKYNQEPAMQALFTEHGITKIAEPKLVKADEVDQLSIQSDTGDISGTREMVSKPEYSKKIAKTYQDLETKEAIVMAEQRDLVAASKKPSHWLDPATCSIFGACYGDSAREKLLTDNPAALGVSTEIQPKHTAEAQTALSHRKAMDAADAAQGLFVPFKDYSAAKDWEKTAGSHHTSTGFRSESQEMLIDAKAATKSAETQGYVDAALAAPGVVLAPVKGLQAANKAAKFGSNLLGAEKVAVDTSKAASLTDNAADSISASSKYTAANDNFIPPRVNTGVTQPAKVTNVADAASMKAAADARAVKYTAANDTAEGLRNSRMVEANAVKARAAESEALRTQSVERADTLIKAKGEQQLIAARKGEATRTASVQRADGIIKRQGDQALENARVANDNRIKNMTAANATAEDLRVARQVEANAARTQTARVEASRADSIERTNKFQDLKADRELQAAQKAEAQRVELARKQSVDRADTLIKARGDRELASARANAANRTAEDVREARLIEAENLRKVEAENARVAEANRVSERNIHEARLAEAEQERSARAAMEARTRSIERRDAVANQNKARVAANENAPRAPVDEDRAASRIFTDIHKDRTGVYEGEVRRILPDMSTPKGRIAAHMEKRNMGELVEDPTLPGDIGGYGERRRFTIASHIDDKPEHRYPLAGHELEHVKNRNSYDPKAPFNWKLIRFGDSQNPTSIPGYPVAGIDEVPAYRQSYNAARFQAYAARKAETEALAKAKVATDPTVIRDQMQIANESRALAAKSDNIVNQSLAESASQRQSAQSYLGQAQSKLRSMEGKDLGTKVSNVDENGTNVSRRFVHTFDGKNEIVVRRDTLPDGRRITAFEIDAVDPSTGRKVPVRIPVPDNTLKLSNQQLVAEAQKHLDEAQAKLKIHEDLYEVRMAERSDATDYKGVRRRASQVEETVTPGVLEPEYRAASKISDGTSASRLEKMRDGLERSKGISTEISNDKARTLGVNGVYYEKSKDIVLNRRQVASDYEKTLRHEAGHATTDHQIIKEPTPKNNSMGIQFEYYDSTAPGTTYADKFRLDEIKTWTKDARTSETAAKKSLKANDTDAALESGLAAGLQHKDAVKFVDRSEAALDRSIAAVKDNLSSASRRNVEADIGIIKTAPRPNTKDVTNVTLYDVAQDLDITVPVQAADFKSLTYKEQMNKVLEVLEAGKDNVAHYRKSLTERPAYDVVADIGKKLDSEDYRPASKIFSTEDPNMIGKKADGAQETFTRASPREIANRRLAQIRKEHGKLSEITKENNRLFMDLQESFSDGTKKGGVMVYEDSVLKQLNDKVIGNKEDVTAMDNLKKHLFLREFEKDPVLKNALTTVKKDGAVLRGDYNDYKAVNSSFDWFSPNVHKRLDEVIKRSKEKFADYLKKVQDADGWKERSQGLALDIRNWHQAGTGRTFQKAGLAARYAREEALKTGVSRVVDFSEVSGHFAKKADEVFERSAEIGKNFRKVDFLENTPHGTALTEDAIEVIRKSAPSGPEVTTADLNRAIQDAIKKNYNEEISVYRADLLRQQLKEIDSFSPGLLMEERVDIDMGLLDNGTMTVDFKGQNSRNLYQTQMAILKTQGMKIDDRLNAIAKGEKIATERLNEMNALVERSILAGPKEIVGVNPKAFMQRSGDDFTFHSAKEPTPEFKEWLAKEMDKNGVGQYVRTTYVPKNFKGTDEAISVTERNAFHVEAESIEKDLMNKYFPGQISQDSRRGLSAKIDLVPVKDGKPELTVTLSRADGQPVPANAAQIVRSKFGEKYDIKDVKILDNTPTPKNAVVDGPAPKFTDAKGAPLGSKEYYDNALEARRLAADVRNASPFPNRTPAGKRVRPELEPAEKFAAVNSIHSRLTDARGRTHVTSLYNREFERIPGSPEKPILSDIKHYIEKNPDTRPRDVRLAVYKNGKFVADARYQFLSSDPEIYLKNGELADEASFRKYLKKTDGLEIRLEKSTVGTKYEVDPVVHEKLTEDHLDNLLVAHDHFPRITNWEDTKALDGYLDDLYENWLEKAPHLKSDPDFNRGWRNIPRLERRQFLDEAENNLIHAAQTLKPTVKPLGNRSVTQEVMSRFKSYMDETSWQKNGDPRRGDPVSSRALKISETAAVKTMEANGLKLTKMPEVKSWLANDIDQGNSFLAADDELRKFMPSVYRVDEFPEPYTKKHASAVYYRHPEFEKLRADLESRGIPIYIDTSLDVAAPRVGAYYSYQYRGIFMKPKSSWKDFVHEAQHADFHHYLEPHMDNYTKFKLEPGKSVADVLPPATVAKLGPEKINTIDRFQKMGFQSLAPIDEFLSTREELYALGWKRYVPISDDWYANIKARDYGLSFQWDDLWPRRASLNPQEKRLLAVVGMKRALIKTNEYATPLGGAIVVGTSPITVCVTFPEECIAAHREVNDWFRELKSLYSTPALYDPEEKLYLKWDESAEEQRKIQERNLQKQLGMPSSKF